MVLCVFCRDFFVGCIDEVSLLSVCVRILFCELLLVSCINVVLVLFVGCFCIVLFVLFGVLVGDDAMCFSCCSF